MYQSTFINAFTQCEAMSSHLKISFLNVVLRSSHIRERHALFMKPARLWIGKERIIQNVLKHGDVVKQ